MSFGVIVSWGVLVALALTALHFGYRTATGVRDGVGITGDPVVSVRTALTAAFLLMTGLATVLVWHALAALQGTDDLSATTLLASVIVIGAAVASLWQWSRVRTAFEALHSSCRVTARLSRRAGTWLGETTIEDLHLTPREREVLDLICNGTISDAAIAEALVISPHTAGTHVRNILGKSELSDRRDLMLFGLASRHLGSEMTEVR